MTYRVDQTKVAVEVATFSDVVRRHWNACLSIIAEDASPREGIYIERIAPIRGLPSRAYLYDIAQETSISGEHMLVLTAEFFPEYALVYVVDERNQEVVVFYLRENRRV